MFNVLGESGKVIIKLLIIGDLFLAEVIQKLDLGASCGAQNNQLPRMKKLFQSQPPEKGTVGDNPFSVKLHVVSNFGITGIITAMTLPKGFEGER